MLPPLTSLSQLPLISWMRSFTPASSFLSWSSYCSSFSFVSFLDRNAACPCHDRGHCVHGEAVAAANSARLERTSPGAVLTGLLPEEQRRQY